MKKKVLYPIIIAIFSVWFIKDDILYLRMFLHKNDIVQIQGIVTAKYTKSPGNIRGGINELHYFIDVQDIKGTCSGASRIAKEEYNRLKLQDKIPILSYNKDCIAAFDMHMYAPPILHFIAAGFFCLIAIVYLLMALKEFLESRRYN